MDFDLYTIVYLIAGLFNLIIVHRPCLKNQDSCAISTKS